MRMTERTSELKELGNVKGPIRKFRVRKARVVAQRVIGGKFPGLVSTLKFFFL